MSSSKAINFLRGHPHPSLLPTEEIQSVMTELAMPSERGAITKSLDYGDEEGNEELLEELELFLKRHTKDDDLGECLDNKKEDMDECIQCNKLFITNGVSHGIDLLCATQTQPGDVVLVERPTYFLASEIFVNHGLVIKSLPMNNSGIDVARLVDMVELGQLSAPRLIYLIPIHQNPTGATMPIQDRRLLASFATRHGVLVIADEVYHLLDWRDTTNDGPRPAHMASLNQYSRRRALCESQMVGGCCTVSSFSKIFSPGVRCGWIEAPPLIVESLKNHGYIQSQGGCAPFIGEIMTAVLKSRDADRVLQRLIDSYRYRANLLCKSFGSEKHIHLVQRPIGGYFIWVVFPPEVISENFFEFCKDKVVFLPGVRCDPLHKNLKEGNLSSCSIESCARLCFANLNVDELEKGAKQLLICLKEYTQILRNGNSLD